MKNRNEKYRNRDKFAVILATSVTMAVIIGLWITLLPEQLRLNRQKSESSSFWDDLKENGQDAIGEWNETRQLIGNSLEAIKEELPKEDSSLLQEGGQEGGPDGGGQEGGPAEEPTENGELQGEIMNFRQKLEPTATE